MFFELMKTHYGSQTGRTDLFWLQDAKTKTWILGQWQQKHWKERFFLPAPPEDITENHLLETFSQLENDLIFHDAGGEKNPKVYNMSLRRNLDDFAKELKEKFGT